MVLHPLDAYTWWKKYRELKGEFVDLVAGESAMSSREDRVASAMGGKINFPDAYILKRLLDRYRPETILEVGSFVGFSSRWLLEASSPWNAKVTSLDPNIRHRGFDAPADVLRKFNARFLPERLEIVQAFFGSPSGDLYHEYEEYEPKRSREEAEQIFRAREHVGKDCNRQFDFIFIDGAHDYDSVMRDFEIALELLTERGCIAFHDALHWPGVYEGLAHIEKRYSRAAEVRILGRLDNRVLHQIFGKFTSGIGFFRRRAGSFAGSDPLPAR